MIICEHYNAIFLDAKTCIARVAMYKKMKGLPRKGNSNTKAYYYQACGECEQGLKFYENRPAVKKKICSKCGIKKTVDNFHRNKRTKDGFQSRCSQCFTESFRKKVRENK